MRITYTESGLPLPVYEPGDFVRLRRDEAGPIVLARAGDWGQVIAVRGAMMDLRLAGHCRPRTTALPLALDIPWGLVEPCDRRGQPVRLQHDLRRGASG
ncbi:MAG TPA: hypothetical protein VE684_07020 [Crenalkalicoccus sp.]|nr:hypothetical protein [Crenalkalicoccus sp.]